MAVSPIYLESLKTYEHFADSDSLFQKAVQKFGLQGGPIESLKRRVLQVQLVRNTRLLEISATLPDPAKAHALAVFLAEATVEINRASVSESDQELLRGIEQQARDLRAHLQETDASWAKAVAAEPTLGLESAMEQAADLRAKVEEQVRSVELEVADLAERAKSAPDAADLHKQESNERARLTEMRKQLAEIDRQAAERERLLATRQAHRDQLDAERKAGQTALAGMEARLRDARGETGFRGERLKIIDPGIVPERPSSPNVPLNIAAALLVGSAAAGALLHARNEFPGTARGLRPDAASGRWAAHAMNSAREQRAVGWAPLFFGVWAAAIALAPGVPAKAALAAPAVIVPVLWWTLQNPARWLALFFGAVLLLPPLPIPIGDSGPHPGLLFAALGLLAGILWLAEWRIVPANVNAAFVTLFGILLASVAPAAMYSGDVAAAGSAARVLLFGISVYVFFYAAYGPGRNIDAMRGTRLLYWAATAGALFACVDFYFQFPAPAGYGPQFVWLDSGVFRRAQGLFYEASTLGNFCAFFLVMIAVALTRPRQESPVSRKALAAGGAVFFAALVLSYSRASLINVGVALGVLMWCNRRRVRFARIAALGAAGALLTWWIFPSFAQTYWMRLSFSAEFLFTRTEGVLSGRVASWQTLVGLGCGPPLAGDVRHRL